MNPTQKLSNARSFQLVNSSRSTSAVRGNIAPTRMRKHPHIDATIGRADGRRGAPAEEPHSVRSPSWKRPTSKLPTSRVRRLTAFRGTSRSRAPRGAASRPRRRASRPRSTRCSPGRPAAPTSAPGCGPSCTTPPTPISTTAPRPSWRRPIGPSIWPRSCDRRSTPGGSSSAIAPCTRRSPTRDTAASSTWPTSPSSTSGPRRGAGPTA